MKYLDRRNGIWRYRRVYPPDVQSVIGREYTKSLKTHDRRIAADLYSKHDEICERNIALARSGLGGSTAPKVRDLFKNVGFIPFTEEVAVVPLASLIQISAQNFETYSALPKSNIAIAALADTVAGKMTIDEVFEEYQTLERDKLRKMSNREKKKFLAPIELAIKEFSEFAGNLDILKLNKKTVLNYVHKLTTDVEKGLIKAGTANKKVMHLRKIFERVREELYPDNRNPFSVKRLGDDFVKRSSFSEVDTEKTMKLLAESKINDDLRAMIYDAKNSGCGPKELALLTASDIFLDAPIPYIRISANIFRRKVKGGGARHRDIPLVGEALEWMKKFPTGFIRYQKDNGGEDASAAANKFLKRHTGKTFYSFRHRFADLLRNTGCDQRIQNAIFGHAGKNPIENYYGNEMIIKLKKEAIEKALAEGPQLLKENQTMEKK